MKTIYPAFDNPCSASENVTCYLSVIIADVKKKERESSPYHYHHYSFNQSSIE